MVESILTFIEQHSQWAAFIIFFIALLESVAIVGILIPGWLLLVGVGSLVGAEILPFYPIVIAAYIGAVLGEYISFYIGHRYYREVLSWPLLKKHKKLVDIAQNFFHQHGVSGVFLGRFFGPTRAVVPLVAGISQMSQSAFFWVNVISGLLWAPLYLTPGILVGAAVSLDKAASDFLLLLFASLAIFVVVGYNYGRNLYRSEAPSQLDWIKAVSAWLIVTLLIIVLVQSPHFDQLIRILHLVLSRF